MGSVKYHATELDLFHNAGERYEILLDKANKVIEECNKLRERLEIALKKARSG